MGKQKIGVSPPEQIESVGHRIYCEGEKRLTRIGLLTPYSGTNLGDGIIQTCVIDGIRRLIPDAELWGITLFPIETTRRHGIPAFPITGLFVHFYSESLFNPMEGLSFRFASGDGSTRLSEDKPAHADPISTPRKIWRSLKTIPILGKMLKFLLQSLRELSNILHEIRHIFESFQFVKKLDMVIVSGGGQLDEKWGGPWGHLYVLFRWAVLTKIARKKFAVLSVGAGELKTRLGKFFVRTGLSFACYRSYRDGVSKERLAKWPFTRMDTCVPDLAFGLRIDQEGRTGDRGEGNPVVGVSPIVFGHRTAWPTPDPEAYERYLSNLLDFLSDLLARGYRIVFFKSSGADRLAIQDLLSVIKKDWPEGMNETLSSPTVETVEDLLEVVKRVDYVVASRLHSVILSHIAGKPALAISFEQKVDTYMKDVGQEEYLLDIHRCHSKDLTNRFQSLVSNAENIRMKVNRQVSDFQKSQERQYEQLLKWLGSGTKLNRIYGERWQG